MNGGYAMPDTEQIVLWLEKEKYDALAQRLMTLGIESVKQEIERLIEQRYEQVVPKEQREQIETQLQEGRKQSDREREAARRYSAVRITEGGISRYFETDNTDMLYHACNLRDQLRGRHGENTLTQEYEREHKTEIDAARFQQYQDSIGHSKNLIGLYDINLDDGVFTMWNPATGQSASYTAKDVSTAAYYAWRNSSRLYRYREQIFLQRLDGRELAGAEPEQEDGPRLEM